MSRYAIDACAWQCLRKLEAGGVSLLDSMLESENASPTVLTEYVAMHELNDLWSSEIHLSVEAELVSIQTVPRRDPNFRRLTQNGAHKGEAETIAWLLTRRPNEWPLFVSRDTHALKCARSEKVVATDVMGAVVDFIAIGCITEAEAREALEVWDDPVRTICRPSDWQGFEATVTRRRALEYPYYG